MQFYCGDILFLTETSGFFNQALFSAVILLTMNTVIKAMTNPDSLEEMTCSSHSISVQITVDTVPRIIPDSTPFQVVFPHFSVSRRAGPNAALSPAQAYETIEKMSFSE
jgi:hypothetical protein